VPEVCEFIVAEQGDTVERCGRPARQHGIDRDGREWFYCTLHRAEIRDTVPDMTITPLPRATRWVGGELVATLGTIVRGEGGEPIGVAEPEPGACQRFRAWSLFGVSAGSRNPLRYLGAFDSREEAERQVLQVLDKG
jgi:hypothetical protein